MYDMLTGAPPFTAENRSFSGKITSLVDPDSDPAFQVKTDLDPGF
jgi:hypothetical protein